MLEHSANLERKQGLHSDGISDRVERHNPLLLHTPPLPPSTLYFSHNLSLCSYFHRFILILLSLSFLPVRPRQHYACSRIHAVCTAGVGRLTLLSASSCSATARHHSRDVTRRSRDRPSALFHAGAERLRTLPAAAGRHAASVGVAAAARHRTAASASTVPAQ